MNSFIRGLGGGIGRAIGRILGLIIVAILGFLLITYLDIDIKSVIRNTLFLNVSAMEQTSDITNQIHTDTTVCSMSGGNGTYCVDGGYSRNVKTTYNGRAQCIGFAFDYYFMSNRDYTLNIIANSNDFRNNNLSFYGYSYTTYPGNAFNVPIQGRFINKQKIQIVFPYDAQETHAISICSNNSYMTGDSNYNIKQVYLTYDDGQQDLSGIVDNATQNTTDIINNNNSNAEQTQNTIFSVGQDIINQVRFLCKNLYNIKTLQPGGSNSIENATSSSFLLNVSNSTNQGVSTDLIPVVEQATYSFQSSWSTGMSFAYMVLKIEGYDNLKRPRQFSLYDQRVEVDQKVTITLPVGVSYIKVSYLLAGGPYNGQIQFGEPRINLGSDIINYCEYGTSDGNRLEEIGGILGGLSDKTDTTNDLLEEQKDKQQETIDTIKDDSIDTTESNDFFNNFQDNTHGLSGIITIPLSTIQSLATKQCSPILLPIPYTGKNITLPCLTPIYEQHVPVLLSLIRTLWYGILSYYVLTDIFFMVKGFKDPDSDKIEVLDL